MATSLILPPPPSNAGQKWLDAWAAYQRDPIGGYAAYYNTLAKGELGAQLLAQGNYPAPGSAGAPGGSGGTGGTPTPPPGTPGSIPGIGNYPTPVGVTITQPAGDPYGAAARFGGVPGGSLDPLNYRVYTGTMSNAALPPATGPIAAGQGTLPATSPVPPTTPIPAPPLPSAGGAGTPGGAAAGQGPPGQSPGAGSGSGGGQDGNAGGAQQAGRNDGWGQRSGGGLDFGRNGWSPASSSASGGDQWGSGDLINLGGWGNGMLNAAGMLVPGWGGVAANVAALAGRGYNTYAVNQIRQQQGLPPLDAGQIVGSLAQLNHYGDLGGNATIANPDQFGGFINDKITKKYAGSPNFYGTPTTYAPGTIAETSLGEDYQAGPGGLLGWIARGLGLVDATPVKAWSANNTNAFLGGPGSMGSTATGALGERGILSRISPTAAAAIAAAAANAGVLNQNRPGSTTLVNPTTRQISYQGGTGSTNQTNPPGSFSGTTAGGTLGVDGSIGTPYGVSPPRSAAPAAPQYSAADQAALMTLQAMPHVGVGKLLDSGLTPTQALARAQAAAGNGTGSFSGTAPTGMGGNGFSGNLSAGAGNAVSAGGTGGLQNGFGGGGYAEGGIIPGTRDSVVDNRPILADEGEAVLKRDVVDQLGPNVIDWLNNARNAGRAAAVLQALADPRGTERASQRVRAVSPQAAQDLRDLTNQEPLMMRPDNLSRGGPMGPADLRPPMPFTGDRQALTPQMAADLVAAMDAEAARGPAPALPGPLDPAAMSGPPASRGLPVPMRKPGAPAAAPLANLRHKLAAGSIAGSGHSRKKVAASAGAKPVSESDRLNQQQLAMILARRLGQQQAGAGGMRFGA